MKDEGPITTLVLSADGQIGRLPCLGLVCHRECSYGSRVDREFPR